MLILKIGVSETSYLQAPEIFRSPNNSQLLATNKRTAAWLPSLEQLSFYVSKMVKFWFVDKLFLDNLPASLTKLVAAAKIKNHVKNLLLSHPTDVR